ncbi:MAG: hypothetical protein CVU92_01235 [Firmicutes bacterium HGW-Firmicutes-17]|nr:MAG: hypothetical protein CVU92_01235 [Firmicutes bacterium HGW-Firmicutes-17]
MRINHNITALNTYNKLTANQATTAKSLEKLSSGLKINRAGDNAAGLAISEKMRGQIRGLDQATSNANDSISLIKTAEGGLNETHSILQRMRELAVQSSNDTNTTNDRAEIQKEIDQLSTEVTRIGNQTEFNTKKLLNGGAGLTTNIDRQSVAGVATAWFSITGGSADTEVENNLVISGATKAESANVNVTVGPTTADLKRTVNINGSDVSFTSTGTDSGTASAAATAINASETGVTARASGDVLLMSTKEVGGSSSLKVISDLAASGTTVSGNDTGANATITSASLGTSYVATGNSITITGGDQKGLELKLNGSVMSTTAASNSGQFDVIGNGSMTMHIGANEGQTMGVSISDMRSEALGVSALDLTTQTGAEAAITTIDTAISTVSSERAKLGAYQNRLEHTINNLGTSSENTSSAESRIRDVDMAKEMMEFTKNNILSQAAQSMLAQANQQPQGVLQLLQ